MHRSILISALACRPEVRGTRGWQRTWRRGRWWRWSRCVGLSLSTDAFNPSRHVLGLDRECENMPYRIIRLPRISGVILYHEIRWKPQPVSPVTWYPLSNPNYLYKPILGGVVQSFGSRLKKSDPDRVCNDCNDGWTRDGLPGRGG